MTPVLIVAGLRASVVCAQTRRAHPHALAKQLSKKKNGCDWLDGQDDRAPKRKMFLVVDITRSLCTQEAPQKAPKLTQRKNALQSKTTPSENQSGAMRLPEFGQFVNCPIACEGTSEEENRQDEIRDSSTVVLRLASLSPRYKLQETEIVE
jgi:hypothetical protein